MGDPKDKLAEKLSWSMEEARVKILADPLSKISKHRSVPYHAWPFRFVLQLDWGRVDDLLRPYTQSSPFSTDLVYKASFLPSSTDTLVDIDPEHPGGAPGRIFSHISR